MTAGFHDDLRLLLAGWDLPAGRQRLAGRGDTSLCAQLITSGRLWHAAGAEWGARAEAYDSLRLLLWQQGSGIAPALAAEACTLLPLLAEHLGEVILIVQGTFKRASSWLGVIWGLPCDPHLLQVCTQAES